MKKSLLYIFLFFTLSLRAQINDAGAWLSFDLEKEFGKDFSLAFNQELRFNENWTELGTAYSDLSASYKINKHFRVSAAYRFIQKRRLDNSYSLAHRYYFDLQVRKKIKPFVVQFRTRFQAQYKEYYSDADGKAPEYYSRNKLTLKLDWERNWTPYVSAELFTNLREKLPDNLRCTAGVDYALTGRQTIGLFYMIQQEFNVSQAVRDFVVGIGYTFNL